MYSRKRKALERLKVTLKNAEPYTYKLSHRPTPAKLLATYTQKRKHTRLKINSRTLNRLRIDHASTHKENKKIQAKYTLNRSIKLSVFVPQSSLLSDLRYNYSLL